MPDTPKGILLNFAHWTYSVFKGREKKKKESEKVKEKKEDMISQPMKFEPMLLHLLELHRPMYIFQNPLVFRAFALVFYRNLISGNKSTMQKWERNWWKRSRVSWHRKFLPLLANLLLSLSPVCMSPWPAAYKTNRVSAKSSYWCYPGAYWTH